MHLNIRHKTRYSYSHEVFIEPLTLRLKPKQTPFCEVQDFCLQIDPLPRGLSESFDPENNLRHLCWFEGLHKELQIVAESRIKIIPFNPWNILIYPNEYGNLPFQYPDDLLHTLKPFLSNEKLSDELIAFGKKIQSKTQNDTVQILIVLTQKIYKRCIKEIREEGETRPPSQTFALKRGACRDLAWMQIQLLRSMGIASRFVSGYYFMDVENPEFELHAWVESYLPGAGWIGLDPTHGILTGNTHIPISQSAHYKNTMPVHGIFRGDAVSSLPEIDLNISPDL